MAAPRADTYSAASGEAIYAGMAAPATLPSWLSGVPLHQWVEISGTSGASLAAVDAFSGFAVTPAGEIVSVASGGHGDSADNRVTSLSLAADAPSWSILEPASGSTQINVSHYADGKPTSRHTYTQPLHVPALGRMFLAGVSGAYGDGYSFVAVDAYKITSPRSWDAAGTYTNTPGSNPDPVIGIAFDGTYIWGMHSSTGLYRWDPVANGAWQQRVVGRVALPPGWPWGYDTSRQQLFGLQSIGGGSYRASKVPVAGTTETAITLSGTGLATFLAESVGSSGQALEYDPENDRFLWYCGIGAAAGRVYAIAPNAGTTWDISILSISGTAPGTSGSAGICGRFRYVASLKGFVVMAQRTSNLFFFRVA